MRYTAWALAALLLNGCLLGTMEEITTQTRDEVRATREKSEHGVKVQMATSTLFQSEDPSARSTAFMSLISLLTLDELNRYVLYLGAPAPV